MNTRPTGDSETFATGTSALTERTTMAEGTVLAGRYRIERLIGEGGMGDVYLATHLKIDKAVAIKVLAPEQMRRPRTVNRFLQEAKAASKIRHAHVVDINDYGESDGCAFFVMEYLDGEDLSALLKREGRQPWPRAKAICIQLLRALSAAHEAGIVHRDIKPHNCFITPREGNPDFVKVIDFGIAKVNDGSGEQLTRTGAIMGTAEYMSPEQGQGAELDGRSDLYSVGVILYRMLTGAVPFKGNNPMAILYQHIHAPRVPPSEACPEAEIGPRLDALVLEALATDREERFASAEAFIAAIEAVDEFVEEEPPPPQRLGWIAGGAALLLLLGIGVWWAGRGGDEPPASDPTIENSPEITAVAAGETTTTPERASTGDPAGSTGTNGSTSADATDTSGAEPLATGGTGDTEPDPTTGEPASSSTEPAPPVRRSTRAIRSQLSRVDTRVRACGKKAGLFPGESVTVKVKIAPNGRVLSAKVAGTFSRQGAACIEKAIRSLRFEPAQKIQSANHRYTL